MIIEVSANISATPPTPSIPAIPPLKTCPLSFGKISYREQGEGEPVLFLHGLLGNSKSWAFQLEAFSKDYRVIAWDAPGFGESTGVPEKMEAFVNALKEFAEALSLRPMHIIGHSMGGSVASAFSALHPEYVNRLILSCTHPGYADTESSPMSQKFENRMLEYEAVGRAEYGMRRARDLLPEGTDEAVIKLAAEVASEVRPQGLRAATRMLQLANNRPLLPRIVAPTLILMGGEDKVVAPHLKEDLLKLTPYQKYIEMPALAHAPYFQAPSYYNGLIHDFLRAC